MDQKIAVQHAQRAIQAMADMLTLMPPSATATTARRAQVRATQALDVKQKNESDQSSTTSEYSYNSSSDDDEDSSVDDYSTDDDDSEDEVDVQFLEVARFMKSRGFGMRNSSDSDLPGMLLAQQATVAQKMIVPRRGSVGGGVSSAGSNIGSAIQSISAQKVLPHEAHFEPPHQMLQRLYLERGIAYQTRPYKQLENSGFFLPVTKEQVDGYSMELVAAVRHNDLAAVQAMHENGQSLQVCNAFGESVMHIVGRRGSTEMLKYLLYEVHVSLMVVCESGRTMLHDACWTARPNFASIQVILRECPDLLLVADNRNFTPLHFVPKTAWQEWNEFIADNADLFLSCPVWVDLPAQESWEER